MTETDIKEMMAELEANAKAVPDDFVEWMWFGIQEKLCGGDILKWKQVGRQNFIDCLNLLSYWHKKDKDYEKQIKRQTETENRNKLANF